MEKKLCKCGCGEEIDKFDKKCREKFFVYGHGNKGRIFGKRSLEVRRQISITLLEQRGGRKEKKYCDVWWDKEYKEDVRKSGCEMCGCSKMLSYKLFGKKLSLHHDKGNYHCAPDDLQTLCHFCHMSKHHLGKKYSEKVKRKISNALKGKSLTEDHKRRIGESCKGKTLGRKRTQEFKDKVSASKKGIPWSEARREAQRRRSL